MIVEYNVNSSKEREKEFQIALATFEDGIPATFTYCDRITINTEEQFCSVENSYFSLDEWCLESWQDTVKRFIIVSGNYNDPQAKIIILNNVEFFDLKDTGKNLTTFNLNYRTIEIYKCSEKQELIDECGYH